MGWLDQVGRWWGLQALGGHSTRAVPPTDATLGSAGGGLILVPSQKLGVAHRSDLLLSSGAGLILQRARQWDGARGEGWLHTHGRAGCGGAGPLGQGDSGPSHARLWTLFPEPLPWEAPQQCQHSRYFGASSAQRGCGELDWALPQCRLWLVGEQKRKSAPEGIWKLLCRDGEGPALH